jgi:GAF domain-containing protein
MRSDPTRLAELRRLCILDTTPERVYDDFARLLSTELSVPVAIVNFLDEQRDWFKSCVGLSQTQSPAITSFCEAFFYAADDMIVVNDTAMDERFATHPLVLGPPYIRFYAAARLRVRGQTVGTLCAFDFHPRAIGPERIEQMRALAAAAVECLEQRVPVF